MWLWGGRDYEHIVYFQNVHGNLADITRNENPRGIEVGKKSISYDTVGSCSFRFGIKQHVEVSEESIKEEEWEDAYKRDWMRNWCITELVWGMNDEELVYL